jgi:hypothetical protein
MTFEQVFNLAQMMGQQGMNMGRISVLVTSILILPMTTIAGTSCSVARLPLATAPPNRSVSADHESIFKVLPDLFVVV